jgi:mannose-1-phosphate guanylyltransferase / mannose-6-phosphate isomerase
MYPKQFIRFFQGQSSSLLATALTRLACEEGFAAPIVVCNNNHRFLVKEEAERADVNPSAIVLEPAAHNTAPAIAIAALLVQRIDPAGILVVMPSDHVIERVDRFVEAVRCAAKVAETGRLVLFGIEPDRPHTEYGYIQRGQQLDCLDGAFSVDAFTEKPDLRTAEEYVAAGTYYWNSGIFVLGAQAFLSELERLQPEIIAAASAALAKAKEDLGFLRLDPDAFATAPATSVDHAVVERTRPAAVVLALDVGWSDVGSWSSLWELGPRDDSGNAVQGYALLEATNDCYIHSERAVVSTIGVKDLIIVDTPDALLVADKSRAQDVSAIVARLREATRPEHAQHMRSYRPWGYFETLNVGPRFQVKLLHVKPGAKLSMQMHHHRSEHWVVVQGTAKVTIGDEQKLVLENQSVYIVATQWHRLENPGKAPLEIIEVQIGTYLGEDDIVRAHDVYNRAANETK